MMRIEYSKTIVVVAVLLLSAPAATGVFLGDGGIHNIDYPEDHLVVDYELPGLETTVNILDTGHVEFLDAFGDSIVNLLGGSLIHSVFSEKSRFNAYGGEMMFVNSGGESLVNIFGGSVESLGVAEDGSASVYGWDFAVDGTPVGYVELSSVIGLGIPAHLTGRLSNGDPLDVICDIYGNGQIFLVPEPATLLLLGLGGLMQRKRRRK